MKLVGLMHARNEGWILGYSARAALRYCDGLVLYIHNSIDDTLSIAKDVAKVHPGKVCIVENFNSTWNEMVHRQEALTVGRQFGGTHFAIVDADEVATTELIKHAQTIAGGLQAGQIATVPILYLRGGHRYHANGIWGPRDAHFIFRDAPQLCWIGDTFHHREPFNCMPAPRLPHHLSAEILHYWGYDEHRLRIKHAWYQMVERVRWPTRSIADIRRMYSLSIEGNPGSLPSSWTFTDLPASWLAATDEERRHYFDPETIPWQIRDCNEMFREHGRDYFAGLNLFDLRS